MTKKQAKHKIAEMKLRLINEDKNKLQWWLYRMMPLVIKIFGETSIQYKAINEYNAITIQDRDYDIVLEKIQKQCDIWISQVDDGLMAPQPETPNQARIQNALWAVAGAVTTYIVEHAQEWIQAWHKAH
jgi:hypothetical protein